MSEQNLVANLIRAQKPGLDDVIYDVLDDVYEGTDYPRDIPSDVIDNALATVAADVFDRAEDMATCNKVDTCTAQAEVLYRLARLLHPETARRLSAAAAARIGEPS